MGKHTPGEWNWWTSNSWRRLRSDLGHGQTADVCCPVICKDGHPDLYITSEDMALIVAAPQMLALLQELIDIEGPQPGTAEWAAKVRAVIAKATGAA